jgi:hypothetical protein
MNALKRILLVCAIVGAGAVADGFAPKEAAAIVGRPLTPLSCAGVARRTTRRMIYATSIYVAVLPPVYTVVVIEGATLYQSGSTYYQASGSQYVVVDVK